MLIPSGLPKKLAELNRTLVMGVLNVTPDSFADGGKHFDFESAILRAKEMIDEGVDIIDVGGESTRPGAERVTEAEELNRVIPVIKALSAQGATISVDTMRANTAKRAVQAGAQIVNDVDDVIINDTDNSASVSKIDVVENDALTFKEVSLSTATTLLDSFAIIISSLIEISDVKELFVPITVFEVVLIEAVPDNVILSGEIYL